MLARTTPTPDTLRRARALLVLLLAAASGCAYSLPLGGPSIGRGRPIGDRAIMVGASLGSLPEVSGTVPEVHDEYGYVVNPVPEDGSLRTITRGIDLLGAAVGLHERLDVGLNLSRGLYATVLVAEGSTWALSVSPAVFRHTSSASGSVGAPEHRGARVTNLNVTGLMSVDPWPSSERITDAYVGLGANRYSAWIETVRERRSHTAVAPSLVAGVRLGSEPGRTHPAGEGDVDLLRTLTVEVGWTAVTQRNGRQSVVPTGRVFLSLQRGPR